MGRTDDDLNAKVLALVADPANYTDAEIAARVGSTRRAVNQRCRRLRAAGIPVPPRRRRGARRFAGVEDARVRFLALLDDPTNDGRRVAELAVECGANPNSARRWARRFRAGRPRAGLVSAPSDAGGPIDPGLVEIARAARAARGLAAESGLSGFGLAASRAAPPPPDIEPRGDLPHAVVRRRIAAWYRWQARRRRLGLPAAGIAARGRRISFLRG